MKKIAFIGQKKINSREGGVEIVTENLAVRLVKLGYDVTCYNRKTKHVMDKELRQSEEEEFEGVKLEWVLTIDKKGLAALTSSFFGTIKILFSDFDVVHFHAEGPCAMIPIIKFFSKKRIIATIHGLDWQRAKWGTGFASKYIKFGEKMAAKYADEVIVLSENVKNYFKETYGRETVFIPNGVNEPSKIAPEIILNKYGLKGNDYFLFLGRIVPEKGIHYLINAFSNADTSKKLVIAGGASDTDAYYDEIKALASKNKNICLTGFVEGKELDELYSNAYVYCLPSDLEGMPLSLLEALSYGNCCLTSDIPECAKVLEDCGVVFKRGDEGDLKDKIEFLSQNEDTVFKFKSMAKDFVLKKYNWDDVVEKTCRLYEGE